MRKFVFFDKTEYEKEIITDLLHSEGIKYVITQEVLEISCDCEDEDCDCVEFLPNYQIEVYTTMEKFEFIKVLFEKKLEQKLMLENCFQMKPKKRTKRRTKA